MDSRTLKKSNRALNQVPGDQLSTVRESSKNWSEAEWYEHLDSIDRPLRETQLNSSYYDQLANGSQTSIFDFAQGCAHPDLKAVIEAAVARLTPSQQQVIRMAYFQSKTTREIAQVLGVSQTAVCNLKKRALKNLERNLTPYSLFP